MTRYKHISQAQQPQIQRLALLAHAKVGSVLLAQPLYELVCVVFLSSFVDHSKTFFCLLASETAQHSRVKRLLSLGIIQLNEFRRAQARVFLHLFATNKSVRSHYYHHTQKRQR
jgi:hypothetical protein